MTHILEKKKISNIFRRILFPPPFIRHGWVFGRRYCRCCFISFNWKWLFDCLCVKYTKLDAINSKSRIFPNQHWMIAFFFSSSKSTVVATLTQSLAMFIFIQSKGDCKYLACSIFLSNFICCCFHSAQLQPIRFSLKLVSYEKRTHFRSPFFRCDGSIPFASFRVSLSIFASLLFASSFLKKIGTIALSNQIGDSAFDVKLL